MLTKAAIMKLEARERDYLVYDSPNLYIRVYRTGRKSWIFRRRELGRDTQMTLGEWPSVNAVEARYRRDEQLKAGTRSGTLTLGRLVEMWAEERRSGRVSEGTQVNDVQQLRRLAPLMSKNVRTLTRAELLAFLRQLSTNVSPDAAHRVARTLKRVYDYGADVGVLDEPHVATSLTRGLPPVRSNNFTSIHDPVEIGRLLRALEQIKNVEIRAALKFVAYAFPRSGEARLARWREIDLENKIWTIPAAHTKMRREQLVPLSTQCVRLLTNLDQRSPDKPVFGRLRRLTLIQTLCALQRLPDEIRPKPMTVHGFRSMASTILNEHGWPSDAIERQLAHVSGGVRAVYNKAQYLDTRREMLQWYADYLDKLRDGVVD